jgi:hypothetical protein
MFAPKEREHEKQEATEDGRAACAAPALLEPDPNDEGSSAHGGEAEREDVRKRNP